MKKYIFTVIVLTMMSVTYAQNTLRVITKDSESNEPLAGVTVTLDQSAVYTTDPTGLVVIQNLTNGTHTLSFELEEYKPQTQSVTIPTDETDIEILLESEAEEMEEVIVTSTRSTRTFRDIPTRVEFIAGEELEEKANMKPGDIRMVLNESTGIQTQQTSATSANATIRIQGLDGRYTQILKDGFPLYTGAASGLGLLQTPPLDLKQVEIIKGSASTLYGGGAIAGLVNLISKTPTDKRELNFLINGTSALGLDVNGFYSQRFGKAGVTIFASHNRSEAYNPSDNPFSAIPEYSRFNFNPKFFLNIGENTKLDIGINSAFEKRTGGDMDYIENPDENPDGYFEKNDTKRTSTQVNLVHRFNEREQMAVRHSLSNFNRVITIPDYRFDGTQISTFSEFTYSNSGESLDWVVGANLWTDDFSEVQESTFPLRDYSQITYGAFIQNTWKAKPWLNIETGLRGDYVVDYGFSFLPRLSALFKINPKLSTRIGGGLGYKAPTIFTDESERIQFRGVLPIDDQTNKLERSYGANFDINYKTRLGEVSVNLNQLFFYTYLNNPLLLTPLEDGLSQFVNIDGNINTKGTETNIKLGYDDFKFFFGYTYTDAEIDQAGNTTQNPLTSRHRLNNVLMYEIEDKLKVGLEGYYYSPQKLNDGTTGQDYWIFGFMVEKIWERFSIFVNFENFTDTRQTKFGSIYTGSVNDPVFKDIYAPLDGFVVNGGIKIRL